MKLSVLIPSIPSRFNNNKYLWWCNCPDEVEVLMFTDNQKRSIGAKRDALLRIANGEYIVWLDDDDDIHKDFYKEVLKAIKKKPDVITYKQLCSLNGEEFEVTFKVGNGLQPAFKKAGKFQPIERPPFHCCVWKRKLALTSKFPDKSYNEDWEFCEPLQDKIKTSVHIDKILHYYIFDEKVTQAHL